MSGRNVDLDKFRLRSFVEKLIAIGEMEVHEQPVSLADLSAMIESSPKAKCFKRVGVEQYEMVAAVSGSRRRHELDGGVYISASIDYTVDPATGKRNVGCRRLMLRSRDTMRANLTDAPISS